MSKKVATTSTESLRYLDANAVGCPSGTLEGLSLFDREDETIGVIDGVLIEPSTRSLRYYVVQAADFLKRRRFLVPADSPAVVLPEYKALRVDISADSVERQRFDSRAVPRFSDDDLLSAMFASRA